MPEGAKERKMVGAAMHSWGIAAMMKMGGNKKLWDRTRGDRQDGGRLTFVPGDTRKNLRISRIKVIRKKSGKWGF